MSKSIFISYVYEDSKYRDQLKDWANRGLLGSDIVITHERKDCRQNGDAAIKEEIKAMIQGCSSVIFLVGQNSHNHPWIDYEAECTISKNRQIIVTRLPYTRGQKPRMLFRENEIPFEANSIRTAIK